MFRYNSATGRAFRQLPVESRVFLIGILAFCYAAFIMLAYHKYLFTGDAIDINQKLVENNYEYTSDNLTDSFCKVEVNAGYGSFYVTPSSNRYSRYNKEGGYYYIAYLEDNSVMAIKVNSSDLGALDVITKNSTGNKRASSSITFEGYVTEMELGNNAKKYEQTLEELGISDSDVRIRYIRLDASTNQKGLWLQFVGATAAGVLLLFGDFIIKAIKRKTAAPVENTIKVNNDDIRFYQNDAPTNLYANKMKQDFSFAGEKKKTTHFNETDVNRSGESKISISGHNLVR